MWHMHEHGLYVYFLRLAECNTQRFLMTESYPITTLVSITTSSNYVVIAAFPTHAKKGAIAQERSSDIVQFCGSISSQACFRLFYLAKFSIICVNLQVLKGLFWHICFVPGSVSHRFACSTCCSQVLCRSFKAIFLPDRVQ